jgi:hypothetical protein
VNEEYQNIIIHTHQFFDLNPTHHKRSRASSTRTHHLAVKMHFSSSVATCLMATSLCVNALPQPAVAGDNDTDPVATTAYFSGTKVSKLSN